MTHKKSWPAEQHKKSTEIYASLKWQLGKNFIDNSLIQILGFDETLDVAGTDVNENVYNKNEVADEVKNILLDKESTIKVAREKISKEIKKRYELYFGALRKEGTTMDQLKNRIIESIQDISERVNNVSIEQLYYDFAFLFSFSGDLKWDHKEAFFGSAMMPSSWELQPHMQQTEFRHMFLNYLKAFFSRLDNASPDDQKKVYFISELLRRQSGERDWIGNTMNPMIQDMTLDDMFGKRYTHDVKWLIPKLKFKIKQSIPGTEINTRKKIGKELEKIVENFLFPKKYYNKDY